MARASIWTPLFYLGVTAAAIGVGVWLWRKGLPAPEAPDEGQLQKDAAQRAEEIDNRQIREDLAAEQHRRGEAQARKEAELLAAERRAAEQGVKTRRDGDRMIPQVPTLKEGARGEEVRKLQEQLKALGFDPGATDSRFGPATARALRAFQQARGLPQTGEVDRTTEEALAAPPTSAPPPPAPPSPPAPQDPLVRLAQALRPSLRQAKLNLTRESEWALVVGLAVLVDQAPPQVFDAEQRAIRQAAASLEGLGGLLGPVRQALSAQTQAELEAAQAAIAAAYPGAAPAVSRLAVFGLGGAKEQILKNVPPPTSF